MSCTPDNQFQNVPTLLQSVSPFLMWWFSRHFAAMQHFGRFRRIVLQNVFWFRSEKNFSISSPIMEFSFKNPTIRILNIARFQRSGELPMTFATQS